MRFSFPICWIWSYFCLGWISTTLSCLVFFPPEKKGGRRRSASSLPQWWLEIKPNFCHGTYLSWEERGTAEWSKKKHCTFLFSSCRCTVKCILNAGRNTKKGCHGDKICQGKQHAILKMNKSINVKAIFFFPKWFWAFVA